MSTSIFEPLQTITVGDIQKKLFGQELGLVNVHVEEPAHDMMRHEDFTVASSRTSVNLVTASVKDLKFKVPAPYRKICQRAQEYVDLCEPEDCPQLCLQRPPHPREILYMAMQPIPYTDSDLLVFGMENRDDIQWLATRSVWGDNRWHLDYRFVFRARG